MGTHSPLPGNPKFVSTDDYTSRTVRRLSNGINVMVNGSVSGEGFGMSFIYPPSIGAYEVTRIYSSDPRPLSAR